MDNNVVIGTKVNTEGVDKGITEIKRKFEDLDDIEVDVDDDLVLEGMTDRLRELHEELKQLENKHVIGDDERERIKEIKEEITAIIDKANEMTGQNYIFKGITDINTKVDTMGKSFEKIGKSVSHLGLKLLGVNSIYGLISSSITRMQGENPQFETFIQAIQNMLDVIIGKLINMIEPFLPRLLPMIEKLLTLIFEIVEALDKTLGPVLEAIIDAVSWIIDGVGWLVEQLLKLMGIDVSSETEQFAKDINEASKGLKKTNKEVQKLRKQLLGFDEMNILNKDTGSVGALGSASSSALGSALRNGGGKVIRDEVDDFIDYMDTLDWLGQDEEYKFITVGNAVVSMQGNFNKLGQELAQVGIKFSEFRRNAQSITEKNGIVTIIGETGEAIKLSSKEFSSIMSDINRGVISKKNLNSWQKLKKSINDIDARRFSITQKAISQGFKDATVVFEDGLYKVRLKTGETISYTEEQFKELEKYVPSLASTIQTEAETTFNTINKDTKETSGVIFGVATDVQGVIEDTGGTAVETFGKILNKDDETTNGIIQNWHGVNGTMVNVFGDTERTGVASAGAIQTAYETTADVIKKIFGGGEEENDDSTVSGAMNIALLGTQVTGENVAEGIINAFRPLPGKIEEALSQLDLDGSLQSGAKEGANLAVETMNKIIKEYNPPTKTVKVKADTTEFEKALTNAAKNAAMTGIMVANNFKWNTTKGAKGLLLNLPRLASGGIINRPGRGVPLALGGAIAGERGREAVLPLTDSQQMEYLGREIAKHIVVNLTNVTELDGRQIARSVTQVLSDMNFASNGGVI